MGDAMAQDPKFIKAINRLREQLERGDYGAALRTLQLTNYLPVKALTKFVRNAPESLVVKILYDFKCSCMNGLNKDNVFDRSIELSVLLKLFVQRNIVTYFREKQQLFAFIESLGVPMPLLLEQSARSIEEEIKYDGPHAKLLASGFTRIHFDVHISKYTHPELPATLVVRTPKSERVQLLQLIRDASRTNEAFEKPDTHEGWLALGFTVKHQSHRMLYYTRVNEEGNEECFSVLYPSLHIATRHFRYSAVALENLEKQL